MTDQVDDNGIYNVKPNATEINGNGNGNVNTKLLSLRHKQQYTNAAKTNILNKVTLPIR